MKHNLNFLLVLIIALCSGCAGNHLITDKAYMDNIDKTFAERRILASHREEELFSVFDNDLSPRQTDALKFLYAFMPLSDLADYDGDFFLANANVALRARNEAQWGRDIPEDIFLHYVLPPRINNENLDSFRIVYYDEITDRIKGLSIRDAALEINHWCHEKVIYQPADIRTSAPMSTILSGRGRCGEESTFTTAALRTAGIPARQVYTPRWAHSDDNHAWVEIWDNGKWYYLGACEPEPVLDLGWFTEPARRAMLVHTKSFGAPYGNENTINTYKYYSDVNNLSKYAVTKEIFVKVSDQNGVPVKNATVEFKLYNYAEFFTLAAVPTDQNGISKFETGLGDLLIWASADNKFDYRKISVEETDTLELVLNRKETDNYSIEVDLNVPPILSSLVGPARDLIDSNAARINEENIIRQKYIDTWISTEEIKILTQNLELDGGKVAEIFSRCMGNYKEIRSFLLNTPESLRSMAVTMLEVLPDKDLRDTKATVLSDHLLNCADLNIFAINQEDNFNIDFILNPRIANEIIAPWRGYFRNNLPAGLAEKAISDPSQITKYLNENIVIATEENYYKTPITPIGVHELKVSDDESRSICFVAICRSLGIPSRLEPGRNLPQYYTGNSWHDVYFADQQMPAGKMGYIRLLSDDVNPVPEYYIHFTLARFFEGKYQTLEYDYNKKITDFNEELGLPPGSYMLVTGNRLADSRILSEISFFTLAENEHITVNVTLRKEIQEKKIIGSVDVNEVVELFDNKETKLKDAANNGLVVIWIEPDKEPTKHILNDLPGFKEELDRWGGNFLFLSASADNNKLFVYEDLKGLPAKSYFSVDDQMKVFSRSVKINPQPDVALPFVLLVDKHGNIVFTSSGYRVGIPGLIINKINNM